MAKHLRGVLIFQGTCRHTLVKENINASIVIKFFFQIVAILIDMNKHIQRRIHFSAKFVVKHIQGKITFQNTCKYIVRRKNCGKIFTMALNLSNTCLDIQEKNLISVVNVIKRLQEKISLKTFSDTHWRETF